MVIQLNAYSALRLPKATASSNKISQIEMDVW